MGFSKKICESLSDKEVISKSLENIDFFACLYERYEPRLLRYIRKISGASHDEAGDILQDAFIKIWKNLHSFNDELKLSSWLYRIVHNETISFFRKKKSWGKNNIVELGNTHIPDMPDNSETDTDPEERYFLTHMVLDQLALKYKEVLVLKFMEKMSYEEISDILKLPEGTVAARINRAKKLFKNLADKQHISFND
ncbi:MAG: sigma-70 family RNA polymerase sigma factor [Bacteroidales bacterium]|nr:sigma-70 family RNA polymerase sigma factor [Bacteroidales bacterium]